MPSIAETVTKTLHGTTGPLQAEAAKKAIDASTARQHDDGIDLNAATIKAVAAALTTGKTGSDTLVEKAKITAAACRATTTKASRMPSEAEIAAEVGPHAGGELRTVGIMRAQRKIALQGG